MLIVYTKITVLSYSLNSKLFTNSQWLQTSGGFMPPEGVNYEFTSSASNHGGIHCLRNNNRGRVGRQDRLVR